MNLIETDNLSKKFKDTWRVSQVNMFIPEGTIYGFLGPNGAGKTTTLKMILGLMRPTQGTITIFNEPVTDHNRLALLKKIGSLIEFPSYYGHLTGAENLKISQILRGLPESSIDEVLKIVRLDHEKHKKVAHYSLGMKQRLGFANALLGFPKVLILDEPTNGLDPAGIQEMRELICSLPNEFGITVLVSSHLLSEIDQIATHVGIIRRGELVFQDTLANLHKKSTCHMVLRTLENERAASLLMDQGYEFEKQDDFLTLPALADDQAAALLHSLIQSGCPVVRFEERKHTLEDIFLAMTGVGEAL